MLFGFLIVALFGIGLLHHEYAFFDGGGEPMWVPTVVPLLMGIWFIMYGLIGYIRKKKEKSD